VRVGSFRPGDTIVRRSVSSQRREVYGAYPIIVVRDGANLFVGYRPAGTARKYARGTSDGAPGSRLVSWKGGYEEHLWTEDTALVLHRPKDAHSVLYFRQAPDGAPLRWYVDMEEPWRSTPIGFDSRDQILDVVIEPDLSGWRWKDEAELDRSVAAGIFTHEKARAIRVEGERAIQRLLRREPPFDENWDSWRPDPSWRVPVLPEGWFDYEPRRR